MAGLQLPELFTQPVRGRALRRVAGHRLFAPIVGNPTVLASLVTGSAAIILFGGGLEMPLRDFARLFAELPDLCGPPEPPARMRVRDGRIVEANQAAVSAYGFDHQALLTMKIGQLRAPGISRGLGRCAVLARADRRPAAARRADHGGMRGRAQTAGRRVRDRLGRVCDVETGAEVWTVAIPAMRKYMKCSCIMAL